VHSSKLKGIVVVVVKLRIVVVVDEIIVVVEVVGSIHTSLFSSQLDVQGLSLPLQKPFWHASILVQNRPS
jgi:hypothetical protein